jgi:hypothetical protein
LERNTVKEIPLTHGLFALVDDSDYVILSKYKWHATTIHRDGKVSYRAARTGRPISPIPVLMHRQIMGFPEGKQVDHINGNPLDNRRANLRICENAQNNRNKGLTKASTSGYKGVSFSKQIGKWRAYIVTNYRQTSLGLFDNPLDAAKAYNVAALKYHGEFARLNEL